MDLLLHPSTLQKQKRTNTRFMRLASGLLILTLLLTACTNGNEGENTKGDVQAASKITMTNEDVGFSLLQNVEPDHKGNVFISPTSLLIAMLMVHNGADEDTKTEIEKALQIDELSDEEINDATKELLASIQRNEDNLEVTIANSLWLNDKFTFLDSFEKTMETYFDAEIAEIDITDHTSADKINHWVKKATNDLIDEIVDQPLSSDLIAYIINVLYFNGTWMHEFDEALTQEDIFYTEKEEIEIPFMTLDEEFSYFETEDFQAVKLPYNEGEMNMQIYLPKEDKSIDELTEGLTATTWQDWQHSFNDEVEGTVLLPKFKLEYDTKLNDALQELGIKQAFNAGQANFSSMIEGTAPLYISEVKQKTLIEVDEKGTEAAAGTSVAIEMTSAPIADERFTMDINRPFLFAIYDEEIEHALFLGIMKEPVPKVDD